MTHHKVNKLRVVHDFMFRNRKTLRLLCLSNNNFQLTISPDFMKPAQVFISYAGHDSFEASLLQFSIETLLAPQRVTAWTYQRDQSRSEKEVAKALKKSVQDSMATVFIVSPSTIEAGAARKCYEDYFLHCGKRPHFFSNLSSSPYCGILCGGCSLEF